MVKYIGGEAVEIRAKCRYDFDSIKALTHLSAYKKSDPKKAMQLRAGLCSVLLFAIIAEHITIGLHLLAIILISAVLIVLLLDLFMYFVLPKIQFKALAKMRAVENDYLFCDNVLKITTKSEEYNGEAEIEYSLFVKVYETSKYFFIYQTGNQVLLVDKSTVDGGSVDDIRNKLSSFVKNKYYICKY